MNSNPSKRKNVIPRLALLDLRHEWILTLCMVLAAAAVLSPLLILLGLKHGTIQTMRDRLIEDPVNREIIPSRTLQLPEKWFTGLRERRDVDFIIPTILRGSSIVRVARPGSGRSEVFDLLPTDRGDPLILENQGVIPGENQCVLSYPAAEKLGARAGEPLTAIVTRTRAGKRERAEARLTVTSVLDPRADALPRVYAPLDFVMDVEAYREGRAIPGRGWPGGQPRPHLSFSSVFVIKFGKPLSSLETRKLTINTGIAEIEKLDAEQFEREAGFDPPPDAAVYRLAAIGNPIQSSNIEQLKNKLRGKSAVVLPWSRHVLRIAMDGEQKDVPVIGVSISSSDAKKLGIPEAPWGALERGAAYSKMGQMLAPPDYGSLMEKHVIAEKETKESTVRFPLKVTGAGFSRFAVVPAELTGTLETGAGRHIAFDEKQGGFILSKAGFRGFRMYAGSIDDVPGLYAWFIGQGIDVITRVQEIEKIKVLDRGLTRIFWLVAVVGIVGGFASLVASLYAAVERKKRDISVLRLMGVSRRQVFWFPIHQGVTIAIMSVFVAILGYSALSSLINMVFSSDLKLGQKICSLPMSYFLFSLIITSMTAGMSSLLAAWKTTRFDPAEAIREE